MYEDIHVPNYALSLRLLTDSLRAQGITLRVVPLNLSEALTYIYKHPSSSPTLASLSLLFFSSLSVRSALSPPALLVSLFHVGLIH